MVNYPFQQIDELDAKDSHNHYRLLIESGYDAKQALKEVAHWTRTIRVRLCSGRVKRQVHSPRGIRG